MKNTTNFFQLLQNTGIKKVSLSIHFNEDNSASIVLQSLPTLSKDKALLSIIPITFTAPVQEIDAEFFNTVSDELSKKQSLYTNVESAENSRKIKAQETTIAKELNDKHKKQLERLTNLVKDESFDPKKLECKNKALLMVEELLVLKPKCTKTIEIKNDIIKKASVETLF